MIRLCLSFLLASSILRSEDWPSYGGPLGNHASKEKSLRVDWNGEEPEILWKKNIGLGFSSVIEHQGRALCQGYAEGKNTLYCLDAKTGNVLWDLRYPCTKAPDYFQGGSRSTPTAFEDKIFLQSHEGDLYALDLESGKILWSLNIVKDLEGERPQWGFAGSPLMADGKLILQTGGNQGSLTALDPENGKPLWRSGAYDAGYASPSRCPSKPEEIAVFNQFGLSIHRLQDGRELGKYQHKTRYGINAAQPLRHENSFLISSAYGKGAALVRVDGGQMRAVWESDSISCQMASLVRKGEFAFGIHGQAGPRSRYATLFCVEISTGKKRWEEKGYGVGSLILIDEFLVVLSDEGTLAIVEASEKGFNQLESFQVLRGKTNWTPPTYANGRMHCRGSEGQWVCLAMGK